MTKKLEEIIEAIKKQKMVLEEKYKVKEIGIFGSYVRGEQTEKSDVDILVEFEGGAKIGLLKFVNMENYLSDILGLKVDLVMKSALKPRIGKQILQEVSYL
jgi:predicted nucleotidyltransferase